MKNPISKWLEKRREAEITRRETERKECWERREAEINRYAKYYETLICPWLTELHIKNVGVMNEGKMGSFGWKVENLGVNCIGRKCVCWSDRDHGCSYMGA